MNILIIRDGVVVGYTSWDRGRGYAADGELRVWDLVADDEDALRSAVARQKVEARTRISQGQLAIELAKVTVVAAERELARAEDAKRRGVMPDIEVARRDDELIVARVRAKQMQ